MNTSPKDVADNIKRELSAKGISIAEAARILGKTPQNLNNILRGTRRPSRATAMLFNKFFDFSVDYICLGEGDMYPGGKSPEANFIESNPLLYLGSVLPQNYPGLSPREKELNRIAETYRQLCLKAEKELALGFNIDINQALKIGETALRGQTEIENKLIVTLYFWINVLRQYMDTDVISKHLETIVE